MKEIRLAIVGSRDFNDYERLCNVVSDLAEREQVSVVGIVSGGALGWIALVHAMPRKEDYS